MAESDSHNPEDFKLLVDMHMFYHRTLVAVGGFVAAAQSGTIAISGGQISDPRQIQFFAFGVLVIALFAVFFFGMYIKTLIRFPKLVKAAQIAGGRSWRPNSEVLKYLAIGFAVLNAVVIIFAVFALVAPELHVIPDASVDTANQAIQAAPHQD